ncbi:glycyl-radical enzyme activating protein [bacterium C-53]|nr:glycyl-radical enzyme activating protein [Lachnospiraceae bacterium]NBI02555.1 glycyl-radical enzyme activating protein [Lachnospiraceae bacterium]RKJ11641.1 glycyl-radical enzyme activating protein [bacterium C-53]
MKKADYKKTGILFNIQKFSVHDGPGIRTVVFLKGCPLRCQWCSNPESQLMKKQILWNQEKCVHCHHCIEICPENAISLHDGRIHISADKCTGCMRCTDACPDNALKPEGKRQTVQEIIDIVMQDQVFYEESGGGITLSGGEILSQPDFALHLLLAAKERGLHTCCETTGYAKTDNFDSITEYVDMILFDLKHWNADKHRKGTGVSNELPLFHMKRAIEKGKDVLPRIPVIPEFNDSLQDAAAFADALHRAGAGRCQLLPFHQFGENKYRLLDRAYLYENVPSLHREDLTDYQQTFINCGINAFF